MKFLLIIAFLFSHLFSGSHEIMMAEMAAYGDDYSKIVHNIYEIKKAEEELEHLHNGIIKIKKENALKELNFNSTMENITDMPYVEVLLLKQNSALIQSEQQNVMFLINGKSIEKEDIDNILDKKQGDN